MPASRQAPWFASVPDRRRYAVLKGETEADVVVIGGGIAGLSAAWHLAKRGTKVVLLEKNRLATGDTGATTGFVTKVPDASVAALTRRYGAPFVRQLFDAMAQAQAELLALIEGSGVACDFRRCDAYYGAYDAADPALAAEGEAMAAACDAASSVDAPAGTPFARAVKFAGEGVYDARAFWIGLIPKAGPALRVYEESEARSIDAGADGVVVGTTDGGTVRAKKVLIATGRPHEAFPELHGLLAPKVTYVIAARYEGEAPAGEDVMWDTLDPYFYFRRLDARTLIVGGRDIAADKTATQRPFEALRAFVAQRLPGAHEVVNEWSGSIFHTDDDLPYAFEHPHLKGRAFAATGFGGNGMVGGFLAGRVLAALASGAPDPAAALLSLARTGAQVGAHERAAEAGPADYVPFCRLSEFEHAPMVCKEVGGRTVVAFKLGERFYALDNACSHAGGSLCDGSLEGPVIECPLHGAKFDVTTGEVKGPPATRPMRRHEVRVVEGGVEVRLASAAPAAAPQESAVEKAERHPASLARFAALPLALWVAEFAAQYAWLVPGSLVTAMVRSLALTGAMLIGGALLASSLFKARPALAAHWRTRRRLGVSGTLFIVLHVLAAEKFYFDFDVSAIFFSLNPLENPIVFGALALPLFLAMALTSTDWMVDKMGFKAWKSLHRVAYLAYWAAIFHFLTIDPSLYTHLPGWILLALTAAAAGGQAYWWARTAWKKRFRTLGSWYGLLVVALYLVAAYLAWR